MMNLIQRIRNLIHQGKPEDSGWKRDRFNREIEDETTTDDFQTDEEILFVY